MSHVREEKLSPEEVKRKIPQAGLLDLQAPGTPKVGLKEPVEGGQQRLKIQILPLKMVGLQKKALVPKERSFHIPISLPLIFLPLNVKNGSVADPW